MSGVSGETPSKTTIDVLLSQYKEAKTRYNDLIKARDNIMYTQILSVTTILAAISLNVASKINDFSKLQDKPFLAAILATLFDLILIILCYTNTAYIKDEFRIYRLSVYCCHLERRLAELIHEHDLLFFEIFQGQGYYVNNGRQVPFSNSSDHKDAAFFQPPSMRYRWFFPFIVAGVAGLYVSYYNFLKMSAPADIGKYLVYANWLMIISSLVTLSIIVLENVFINGQQKRINLLNNVKLEIGLYPLDSLPLTSERSRSRRSQGPVGLDRIDSE